MADRDWSNLIFANGPPEQAQRSRDWSGIVLGDGAVTEAHQPQQASDTAAPPFPGYKNPKEEGWGEWLGKNVSGRVDPRFGHLPSIDEALRAEGRATGAQSMRTAVPFVHSDTGLANVAKKDLGDRYVRTEKDAYGVPVLVYRGPDGTEAKAYANKPGLDGEDIANGVMQAVPYIVGGGLAGAAVKGAGVGLNALLQAGAAGSTSIMTDLVGALQGSEEGIDSKKAMMVGGLSGAVPLVGAAIAPLVRRFWTVPGLYDKQAGQLTPKGEAAAKASGLDPAELAGEIGKQFADEYAKLGLHAGKTLRMREFGIPGTRGQMLKDPAELLTEKAMRHGVYGDGAKSTLQSLDAQQASKISQAVMGGEEATKSIAMALNPARAGSGVRPVTLGENVRGGLTEALQAAKNAEDVVWKRVGPLKATPDALAEIAPTVQAKIGSMRIDDKLTPKAFAMAEELDGFIKGSTPRAGPDVLGQAKITDVGDMRKRLLSIYKGASDRQDVVAAKAVYDGFNDWIETAAQKALLVGDAQSAAMMRIGRDVTKEMKSIFGERDATGAATAGRRLLQDVMDDGVTPEAIARKLFSVDPGAAPKGGTLEALQLMKRGLDRYLPPDRAALVWNDVRLAHWQGVVETSGGGLHTPTMMANRIDRTFNAQSTIMRTLYTPEEQALIRRFGGAMRDIAYKDPNPSGSGVAAAFFAGQFGRAVMRMLAAQDGPLGKMLQVFMGVIPVNRVIGGVSARSATGGGYGYRPSPEFSSVPASATGFATRRSLEEQ